MAQISLGSGISGLWKNRKQGLVMAGCHFPEIAGHHHIGNSSYLQYSVLFLPFIFHYSSFSSPKQCRLQRNKTNEANNLTRYVRQENTHLRLMLYSSPLSNVILQENICWSLYLHVNVIPSISDQPTKASPVSNVVLQGNICWRFIHVNDLCESVNDHNSLNFWPTYLCPTVLKLSDQHQQNTKYTLWFLSPSIPTTSTYSLPPSNGSRNTTHCSAGKLQWRGMPVPLLWCLCPERRYWQNFSCNREMVTWCRDKIRWNDSEMVASIFWKQKISKLQASF